MLSLRQLQCLIAIGDTLHFRRAAERLNLSQPALSAALVQLEEHLGVLLVERTRRRVLLTPLGREISERARNILRDVKDLEDIAQHGGGPLSGTLRLGVLRTLGPYLLSHLLPAMRHRFPDLKLYLRENPQAQMLAELIQGDLDLIIIAGAPRDNPFLTVEPLFHEPLWAALPLGHPCVSKSILTTADLKGEEFILLELDDGLSQPLHDLCQIAGAREHPDFRATSLDALRQMVATGLGATLLPALYVAAEALVDKQIAMRPLAPPVPARAIEMVWRRTMAQGADFHVFANLVRENLPPSIPLVS